MKLISALILFSFCLLLCSCKKEVISPTEAEKTQVELQQVINARHVDRVYAFDYPGGGWTMLPAAAGQSWTFSNGYISINGYVQSRNLAYLYTYNVANVPLDNGSIVSALLLHFK